MATDPRHAAWHQRSFAVRLLPAEGEATDLAADLDELFDAIDLAAEWLEREDPRRDGTTRVAIFETRDGVSHKVWDYPPQPGEKQLVELFGFDPVGWKSAVPEFTRPRRAGLPPPPRPRAIETQPAEVAAPTPPAPSLVPRQPSQPKPARTPRPGPVQGLRPQIVAVARAAWADRVSRYCLVLAALSLWLALTLTDPSPLVALMVAAAGLWWRRAAWSAAQDVAQDDWL
jgi:hypothetical protein